MKAQTQIGVLLLAIALFAGCKEKNTPSRPAPSVELAVVAEAPIVEYISAVGAIKAYDEVALVARVEGFLQKRNFKEGQAVKQGELLYEIEPVLYEAEVRAAQANLDKANAALRNAEEDYKRQSGLRQKDATSERTYENAEARRDEAKADAEVCKAKLITARQNLEYTRITAPFNGWIGLSAISEGNLVSPASGALASVVRIDRVRLEFVINEMDLLMLQQYQKPDGAPPEVRIRLFLQNGMEYPEPGKLSFWNNQINPSTGTLKLQAVFENPKEQLLPGMFARVRLEPAKAKNKLLVPLKALMADQAGSYVYTVDNQNKVVRKTIETSFQDDQNAVVTKNLNAGERVIVDGLQKVRPGQVVTPKDGAKR